MSALVEFENLSFHYQGPAGKTPVIRRGTGAFHSGQVYAITGRSGAGKSTLLTLLAGMDLPSGGTLRFNGEDLLKMDRDAYRRKHLGMVFQQFHLLPQLTALENVMLSLELAGFPPKEQRGRAEQLLEQVGIEPSLFHQRALKLSGGQQQRVAIARALGPNPALILADEPTGNLDSETEQAVVNLLLAAAHQEGRCVVIVTHSSTLARRADQVWAMKEGVLLPVRGS